MAADLGHHAGRLVAEHHRLAHHEGADMAVRVVVDVAATHTDGVDGDADVVGSQCRRDLDVAQRQLVLTLQDQ